MLGVFFAQYRFLHGNSPINSKAAVQYADAAIRLRVVELIALILEHCSIAKHRKSMSKTLVYKKKTLKEEPAVPDHAIKLDLGEKSLVYSDPGSENAILVTWNTPERNVSFSVRSMTTFRQMKAFLKNYNRNFNEMEKP